MEIAMPMYEMYDSTVSTCLLTGLQSSCLKQTSYKKGKCHVLENVLEMWLVLYNGNNLTGIVFTH